MLEIRQSDNKKFYYAVDIDAENNEQFIGENESLDELKKSLDLKGKKVEPVAESKTRERFVSETVVALKNLPRKGKKNRKG